MSADRIFFAQHGLAVDKADDPERPLSKTGIEQTEDCARHLKKSKIPISQIFHSEKLRASQTANIVASMINVKSVSAIDHLSPNDDVTLIAKNLNISNALYVGHLPHLDKLASYLICGDSNQNIIKFQNSAILCLEKTHDRYQVRWYLTPGIS